MNINPLTNKMSYANFRGRAQNSNITGIFAPDRLGNFFMSDLVGSAANILNKRACVMSRFELPTPCGSRELIKRRT